MLACNLVRYDLQNCGLTVENVHSAHLNTNLSDRIYVRFYSNISWELCDVSRRNVIKLVYVRYRSCGRRLSSTLKIMRKMNFLHIVHSTWASESQTVHLFEKCTRQFIFLVQRKRIHQGQRGVRVLLKV